MSSDEIEELREQAYSAQLFGFTADDFMLAIKGMVKEEVTCHIDSLSRSLLKKFTSNESEVEVVKDIVKTLIDQYMNASAGPLNTLETQMKDLLRIPPHVLLPGDEVQRTQYSVEDVKEADEQFQELLNRMKRTKAFDNELRKELKVLRDTLPLLTKHVQDCELMATSQQQANVFYEQVEPMIDHAISTQLQFLSLNKDA